jgi:hypothetical protein
MTTGRCPSLTRRMREFIETWFTAHHARSEATREAAIAKARTIAEKMSPEERERVRAFIGLTRRAA